MRIEFDVNVNRYKIIKEKLEKIIDINENKNIKIVIKKDYFVKVNEISHIEKVKGYIEYKIRTSDYELVKNNYNIIIKRECEHKKRKRAMMKKGNDYIRLCEECIQNEFKDENFMAHKRTYDKIQSMVIKIENEKEEKLKYVNIYYYNLRNYLVIVDNLCKEEYISDKEYRNTGVISTSEKAWEILEKENKNYEKLERVENFINDFLKEKKDYIKSKINSIDLESIENTAIKGYFEYSKRKILCCIYKLYIDSSGFNLSKNSEYMGEIGKRINIEVKINNVIEIETKFGIKYIIEFEDKNGNKCVWKTSIKKDLIYLKGKEVNICCTIKDHLEFKGKKETIVERCKIIC